MGKSLVTGIEIGHHSIKAVVLKPNKGTFALVDYQELPIEAGIFSDNHMSNYQKIVKKLKELRKCLPRFSTKVALAIPDNAVISKVLQIDSELNSGEIEFTISQAFSHQSSFPIEELYLDYVRVSQATSPSKASFQVYATKKELVSRRVEVLKRAGFQPIAVDVQAYAFVHIWQLAARVEAKSDWLLLDVDSACAFLCIDLPDKAPYCKEIVLDIAPENGADEFHALPQDSQLCIRQLYEHTQRNMQLITSLHGVAVSGIWLTGAQVTPSLVSDLSKRLNIECALLNPLSLLDIPNKNEIASFQMCPYGFALATGIALRGLTWLESSYAT